MKFFSVKTLFFLNIILIILFAITLYLFVIKPYSQPKTINYTEIIKKPKIKKAILISQSAPLPDLINLPWYGDYFKYNELSKSDLKLLEKKITSYNSDIFKFVTPSKQNPMPELINLISTASRAKITLLPIINNINAAIINSCHEQKINSFLHFSESYIRIDNNNEPYPFIVVELFRTNPFELQLNANQKKIFIQNLSKYVEDLNKVNQKHRIEIVDENDFIYLSLNEIISHVIRLKPRKEKIMPVKELDKDKSYFTFILDDVGENRYLAKKFMELPFPIIFSILPDSKYATYIATIAHEKGFPAFLHQPMEAKNSKNNSKAVLTTNMSYNDIIITLQKNMLIVPNIRGINNHTGSKFTENKIAVNNFLMAVKKIAPQLLVLDSYTSNKSVLYPLAKEQKLLTGIRNFFIDNINTIPAITSVLNQANNYAKKTGHAYVLGHARSITLRALQKWKQSKELAFILPSH